MNDLISRKALNEKLKRTSAFECIRNAEDKNVFEIINDLASEHNNGWIEKLLEAKKNCGEDSDCSECPFGQIEDMCILQELQIEHNNEFCEWEIVSDKDIHREYKPMCSEDGFVEITGYFDYEFCPYCGKKIKVVE